MSDSNFDVNIRAVIDGFKAKMAEASGSLKESSSQMKESVNGLNERFEKLKGAFIAITAIAAGGKMFKDAIDDTVKMGTEVENLARTLGVSQQQALIFRDAISDLGGSSGQVADASAKLSRQLKNNEDDINALGVKTRDASGNFRGLDQILLDSIETLNGFKEGEDQAQATQVLFGRGVGDLTTLLKLNRDELAESKEQFERYGLTLDDVTKKKINDFKKAQADASTGLEVMNIKLGLELMPTLTNFANWLEKNGTAAVKVMVTAIKIFETAITGLAVAFHNITVIIGAEMAQLVTRAQAMAASVNAAVRLDFTGAEQAWKDGTDKIEAIQREAMERIKAYNQDASTALGRTWGITPEAPSAPGAKPNETGKGGRTFDLPNDAAKAAAKKAADEAKAEAKRQAEERKKIGELEAEEMRLRANETIEIERDKNKELLDLDRITKEEYYNREIELNKRILEADIAALEQKKQVEGEKASELKKIDNEILAAKIKNADEERALRTQILVEQRQQIKQLSDSIVNGFSTMIKGFVEGTATMKDAFKNFALGVIDSLQQIFLKKLATNFFDSFGGEGGIGGSIAKAFGFANGGVFSGGNVTAFARGGVVNSPMVFPMANGMGLMGEAGAEAVMPLARDSSGRLGVRAAGGGGMNISTGVTINFNGSNPDSSVNSNDQIGRNLGQMIQVAVTQKIQNELRPGGMLEKVQRM